MSTCFIPMQRFRLFQRSSAVVCQLNQLTEHISTECLSMFAHIPRLCRLISLPLLCLSSRKRLLHCPTNMKLAPTVKLNNGYEMPILGLGTYNVSAYKKVTNQIHLPLLTIAECTLFIHTYIRNYISVGRAIVSIDVHQISEY